MPVLRDLRVHELDFVCPRCGMPTAELIAPRCGAPFEILRDCLGMLVVREIRVHELDLVCPRGGMPTAA